MEETLGIQETKEVLKFVIDLGEAADAALADGKFEAAELGLLITPLMAIGPALTNIASVSGEIKDLSEAEMQELVAYVEGELDLVNDNVEKIIEDGLSLALRLYAYIRLFAKKDEAAPVDETPADPAV